MGNMQFSLIKKQFVVFVSIVLCSLVLVLASFLYTQQQLDEEKSIKTRMRSLRVNIANIAHDKVLIKDYQLSYESLTSKGFFDREKRLAWIEQLQMTADRLGLPNLRYQINLQTEIKQGELPMPSSVTLFKSQLNFQTRLLHEGDLLSLIGDLQNHNSGLLVVDHCKLSRNTGRDNHSRKSQNDTYHFHSECDVSWYTLGKRTAPGLPRRDGA
ncbi:hypothetical protein A9Q89_11185 [Gammaproteobacteria bacterium 53_120_T64]|nr:hypothetical protein A9Q89_11185 [Gammaproteobacteria bacterium 53_120_T64]